MLVSLSTILHFMESSWARFVLLRDLVRRVRRLVTFDLPDKLSVLSDCDSIATSILPNPITFLNTAWTALSGLCAARSNSCS